MVFPGRVHPEWRQRSRERSGLGCRLLKISFSSDKPDLADGWTKELPAVFVVLGRVAAPEVGGWRTTDRKVRVEKDEQGFCSAVQQRLRRSLGFVVTS